MQELDWTTMKYGCIAGRASTSGLDHMQSGGASCRFLVFLVFVVHYNYKPNGVTSKVPVSAETVHSLVPVICILALILHKQASLSLAPGSLLRYVRA
jgi:hypothetical protein